MGAAWALGRGWHRERPLAGWGGARRRYPPQRMPGRAPWAMQMQGLVPWGPEQQQTACRCHENLLFAFLNKNSFLVVHMN